MRFMTHDLQVAAGIADRIAVMQRGRLVQFGAATQVLLAPDRPCTAALVGAAPGRASQARKSGWRGGLPLRA